MARRKSNSRLQNALFQMAQAGQNVTGQLLRNELNKNLFRDRDAAREEEAERALREKLALEYGIVIPEGQPIDTAALAPVLAQQRSFDARKGAFGEFTTEGDPDVRNSMFAGAAAMGSPFAPLMGQQLEDFGSVPLENRIGNDPERVGIAMADPSGRLIPSRMQTRPQPVPDLFATPGAPTRDQFEAQQKEEELAGVEEESFRRTLGQTRAAKPEKTPEQIEEDAYRRRRGIERAEAEFAPAEEAESAEGNIQALVSLADDVLGDPGAPGSLEETFSSVGNRAQVALGQYGATRWMQSSDVQEKLTGIEALINQAGVILFGGRGFSDGEREAMMRSFMPQATDRQDTALAKARRLRTLLAGVTEGRTDAVNSMLPRGVRRAEGTGQGVGSSGARAPSAPAEALPPGLMDPNALMDYHARGGDPAALSTEQLRVLARALTGSG